MSVTVRELAELVRGTIVGDADTLIAAARTLPEARTGDITFLENPRQVALVQASGASAALVPLNTCVDGKTLIQVADPLMSFATIFGFFQGRQNGSPTGIDPHALIHPSARIGAEASIAANVSVGANVLIGQRCRLLQNVVIGANCRLGNDVHLYPNVVLYPDTVLGDRVIVHANAVLGADGFGYRFQQGRYVKVPQLGNVVVGSDVEIGACTTIDRGTFQSTRIGEGTKIDNLVQIGHNCQIGAHNVFAGQAGIAGSCTTGNYVAMGGQAGIIDHINVGDAVMIAAAAAVFDDLKAHSRVFGSPARQARDAGRLNALLKKLPAMRKDLLRILRQLNLDAHRQDADANDAGDRVTGA